MSNCHQCGGTLNGYELCEDCARPQWQAEQQFRAAAVRLANGVRSALRAEHLSDESIRIEKAELEAMSLEVLELEKRAWP